MRPLGPALAAALGPAVPASAGRTMRSSGRTLDHVAPRQKTTVRLTDVGPDGTVAKRIRMRVDVTAR